MRRTNRLQIWSVSPLSAHILRAANSRVVVSDAHVEGEQLLGDDVEADKIRFDPTASVGGEELPKAFAVSLSQ